MNSILLYSLGIVCVVIIAVISRLKLWQKVWKLHKYPLSRIKTFIKGLRESRNLSIHFVDLDVGSIMEKSYIPDCPNSLIVFRKSDKLVIDTGIFDESCYWYIFPCVSFYVGKKTGRIKLVSIGLNRINHRGRYFRSACRETDWKKYFASIVMAHLEVLKFSQNRTSHHPVLISRIFNKYGDEIFRDIKNL